MSVQTSAINFLQFPYLNSSINKLTTLLIKPNMAKLAVSCILFIFFINTLFQSGSAAYNVINFGAKPDGKTDATQAFLRAWSSACYANSPATLHVPRGLFLVKSISFNGPCRHRIVFHIDGTIIAPSSYWSLGNSGFWILFYKVNRLSIHGGTIDATGAGYWACRKSGKSCPPPTRVCYEII